MIDTKNIIQIEHNLLATMAMDNEYAEYIITKIEPKHFTNEYNRKIYETFVLFMSSNRKIDIHIVNSYLMDKYNDTKFMDYLMEIYNGLPTAENYEEYIKAMLENYTRMIFVRSVEKLKKTNFVYEDIVRLSKAITNDLNVISNISLKNSFDIADEYVDIVGNEKRYKNILKTGFNFLDSKVKIDDGTLLYVAARSGTGKTAFALSLMNNFCKADKKVTFISMEMKSLNLNDRLCSMNTAFTLNKLHNEKMTPEEKRILEGFGNKLKKYKYNLYDKGSIDVDDLYTLVKKQKQNNQIDVLIIDHIGLLTTPRYIKGAYEQAGYKSRKLKEITMDMEIPIIVIVQLGRKAEEHKPSVSHLRDSGRLEEDADVILLLSLAEEYDYKDNEKILDVKVGKNRTGQEGTFEMKFYPETMIFKEGEPRWKT